MSHRDTSTLQSFSTGCTEAGPVVCTLPRGVRVHVQATFLFRAISVA